MHSHGKVCDLIINYRNSSNDIPTKMVEKLWLKIEEHPKLYKIQWFHKSSEGRVNKHCLIPFSIGRNSNDEIWCNVALIDVSHLLLDKPWLHDRKVVNNDFKNI